MAGYTLLRQDDDIRKSGAYDDTIASSLANMETNSTDAEYDFNAVRSVLFLVLDDHAGDWYTDLVTPAGLGDTGSRRGVNDLNTDVHLLERKRVLVKNPSNLTDITVAAAVAATGTLTSSGVFANNETVTIGSRTYTFKSPFSDAADNIDASGTTAQTHENLRRAINGDGVAGTNYGTGTVVHADVTATDGATTNVITAKKAGTFGNLIATTETGANIAFGAATLAGGSGGDVKILTAGELPPNLIANVGNTNTLGTMVAAHTGTFGVASLDEIAGGSAIIPWNMVEVLNGDTRDPLLTAEGTTIYALLQGESGLADGDTIVVGTPDRVQVTFVTINAEGNDLETIDGADLGGIDVNLCYTEQKALFDLSKGDFLRGAVVDNIASSGSVNRQNVYNNQSTVPVELTNNADLDLAAGIEWAIRDAADADLFKLTEDTGGSGTTLLIGGDVDLYDNNAVDVDFVAGIAVGSGGTEIAINETAGVIERAADLILRSSGAGETYLDDSNQSGSSWAQTDGIKLSDTTAEWNAYETAFGGEVSLLAGIVAAYNAGADPLLTWHEVLTNTSADTDVSGPANGNEVDANFPDLSAGTFETNHWLFLNGRLMRPGANAAANYDYYPGTALTPDADLRFERSIKDGDVIGVVVWP